MAESIFTRLNESVKARFWDKVDKRHYRQCWEWKSRRDKDGYGHFRLSGKRSEYQRVRAHRVALVIGTGEDRPDLLALHSCDNPACVNPAHLRWGTQSENMQDALERGRFYRGGKVR
jgi:hypothetical protein